MTFPEWSVWAGPAADRLERRVHELLHPSVDRLWSDYAWIDGEASFPSGTGGGRAGLLEARYARWRNATCEVLSLASHIRHGGGVYVTANGTTDGSCWGTGTRAHLQRLGAGEILDPRTAALNIASGLIAT